MSTPALYRLSAFTTTPEGGNPAGVWIGEALPDRAVMQTIAAEVGFSETAFIAPSAGRRRTVRFYSPEAEVPFCGHATIASGVLLGELDGDATYTLSTAAGDVPVKVETRDGVRQAALTSVEPRHTSPSGELLDGVLRTLGWTRADLDPALPPARAFAGAWHVILAAERRERLQRLEYDFDALKGIMLRDGLTTIQLVWRESPVLFHARNPFPVGGVVEDPATGAAAAALGGYLRAARLAEVPGAIEIRQGDDMGRPSRITVEIPATGGIVVRGTAVRMG